MRKILIFDSSTVITLALNNLLNILSSFKKGFDGEFIVTWDVQDEIINRPLNIKRFELEALMIRQLLGEGILQAPDFLGIGKDDLNDETSRLLDIANHTFKANDEWIRIVSRGEISCLALANLLNKSEFTASIAVDERTTRMLCEKPENLGKLLERKLHTHITSKEDNFSHFLRFSILRSSELCYIAFKKGIIEIKDGSQVLDALLYATKFKGCAISREEIEYVKRRI